MAPCNHAAHLQHYEKMEHNSLQAFAKLRSQNAEGSKYEIVARLVVQDEKTGTWPGMNYTSTTQAEGFVQGEVVEEKSAAPADSEGWEVVPAKKNNKARWAEKVEVPGYMEEALVATDEERLASDTDESTVAEMEPEQDVVYPVHEMVHDARAFESADGKNDAIPMQQLADKLDAYWSASNPAPKNTAVASPETSGSSSHPASTGATAPADSDKPTPISWPEVLQGPSTKNLEKELDEEHQDAPARQGGKLTRRPR